MVTLENPEFQAVMMAFRIARPSATSADETNSSVLDLFMMTFPAESEQIQARPAALNSPFQSVSV
ncbi:hypothetical protein Bca52824_011141 [Brassica carinata]|uniref:Uncharacterized protein n=1 Tax=Brassica carinata TaxID=52824 RepID=A0A8X7WCQ1_BRACI|nr:hypothetical protein Bca52824_011141 [Brassica carinata]